MRSGGETTLLKVDHSVAIAAAVPVRRGCTKMEREARDSDADMPGEEIHHFIDQRTELGPPGRGERVRKLDPWRELPPALRPGNPDPVRAPLVQRAQRVGAGVRGVRLSPLRRRVPVPSLQQDIVQPAKRIAGGGAVAPGPGDEVPALAQRDEANPGGWQQEARPREWLRAAEREPEPHARRERRQIAGAVARGPADASHGGVPGVGYVEPGDRFEERRHVRLGLSPAHAIDARLERGRDPAAALRAGRRRGLDQHDGQREHCRASDENKANGRHGAPSPRGHRTRVRPQQRPRVNASGVPARRMTMPVTSAASATMIVGGRPRPSQRPPSPSYRPSGQEASYSLSS